MSVQLNFTLRTSANCKTVHLVGTWDNYTGQLPLSKDSKKTGGWKGSFRFQGKTLQAGQRYWYYYVIDGYHVSHDPARDSVIEPTTKRRLNVLDIPASKDSVTVPAKSSGSQRPSSVHIAKGRSPSPSRIVSPQPTKPHATRTIRTEAFPHATVDALSAKFAAMPTNDNESSDDDSDYDSDSDVPSLSSSSRVSTPSSVSSTSSACECERYGITRAGDRIKLDCGGSRCGYTDGSDCSDAEDDIQRFARRRHGVVMN